MNELISQVKVCNSISEVNVDKKFDDNGLLYAITKSERYDLLKNSDLKIDFSNADTSTKLIEYLLSDEDIVYYMRRYGYQFSSLELDSIFNIVYEKYGSSDNDYKLDGFFRDFFGTKDELDIFISNKKDFFEKYLNEKKSRSSYVLKDCNSFIELILKNKYVDMINNVENYSVENLTLLASLMKDGLKVPYYLGRDRVAYILFENKDKLDSSSFYQLLNLLQEKNTYDRKLRESDKTLFSSLVEDNIEYLIHVASAEKKLPKCLCESASFRDECIKRNRIDLASRCILSPEIFQSESLVKDYCSELNIDLKDFYERSKWLLNYQEQNNNVFNTFLATSLQDGIFNLNKEHYERFINDVQVQMLIGELNEKELKVLSKILDTYNYRNFDPSLMIVSIVNNIKQYSDLINCIDISNISEKDLKRLVSVLQLPNNQYNIVNLETLQQYDLIKKNTFVNNFSSNDIIHNKDMLLKLLFNINIEEAKYIDTKYCHKNDDSNILDSLKESELQPEIYNYLSLINKIVECKTLDELIAVYDGVKDSGVYDSEVPLEQYLRSKYTELYSESLYRIDEKNQVFGPRDNVSNEVEFNGKRIQVCIPRANFNFFIHCVGSCSLSSDVYDTNYRNDWLDRPQLQDHFVACSYINERGINSIRSQGSIIFGFDSLEGGSIMGMGNTDIDSIGRYANAYDGSRELQEENGSRARFFVPSEMLKTINDGYNEIVVERRNTDKSKGTEFKRKPDYIIMMADSLEQENFNFMDTLYNNQLSFISVEDREEIRKLGDKKNIKNYLSKYKEVISQNASIQGLQLNDMANMYVDLIVKAKYYEDCLKASSEFDIPLVVVDKKYYFQKIMYDSGIYSPEVMEEVSAIYNKSDERQKTKIFNMVATGKDVTPILQPQEKVSFTIRA